MYREYLQKNSWKHTKQKLKTALILFCVVLATAGVAYGALSVQRIWEKQLSEATFVVGTSGSGSNPGTPGETGTISAFLTPSWSTYQAQTEKLNLGIDHTTMIVIIENTTPGPLMLEIEYTISGSAVLICTGQYVELYRAADVKVINTISEPFNVPLDGTPTILSGKMQYFDCYLTGVKGYALRLDFSIVEEGMQTGSYSSNIVIGLCIPC